jgi:Flp pilus assembly protein CpaB
MRLSILLVTSLVSAALGNDYDNDDKPAPKTAYNEVKVLTSTVALVAKSTTSTLAKSTTSTLAKSTISTLALAVKNATATLALAAKNTTSLNTVLCSR